ncbi:MAG TPA: hypothetical protein VHO72_12730 [Bacteroidales bacterium]|nr:hypothetical protein [Bacteroidales bacterium]
MKLLILALFACFYFVNLSGQNKKKVFSECNSMRNSEVYRGDTIIVRCDSIIMLTRQKFRLYQNNNRTYAEIVRTYDNYIDVLEKRSEQQTMEYNRLKLLNDSIIHVSGKYADSIDWKVDGLKTGLAQSLEELKGVKTDVTSLKTDVQKAGKLGKLKSKFLWGGAGVIVGIIVGQLL